jgi:thiol-disulfide isomerase/thioredoxin
MVIDKNERKFYGASMVGKIPALIKVTPFLAASILCALVLPLFAGAENGATGAIQNTNSAIGGIGAELRQQGTNVLVNSIIPDTPAAAQKTLQAGDRIIAVAEADAPAVPVTNLMQTVAAVRGPKGTTVRVTIVHPGEENPQALEVSFVRGEVKRLWGDGVLLANGIKAPDIEMVDLTTKRPERPSDYAGKIIVLEFWATWCGPCQPRMAELQTYPGKNPNWKENVILIAASIDESGDKAVEHLKAKGWDQTHNVRVEIPALRAYHVDGIPTVYVIGRRGEIVAANPQDICRTVNQELERN